MHSKTKPSLLPPLEYISPLLLLLAIIFVYKLTYFSWDEFPKPIGILIQHFHTQTFSPIIFRQLVLCPYYFKQLHFKNQMCWRHLLTSWICLLQIESWNKSWTLALQLTWKAMKPCRSGGLACRRRSIGQTFEDYRFLWFLPNFSPSCSK